MLTKEKVLKSIDDLPSEFSLDDLIEKVIILEKVEIGLHQVKEGKVITLKKLKKTSKMVNILAVQLSSRSLQDYPLSIILAIRLSSPPLEEVPLI